MENGFPKLKIAIVLDRFLPSRGGESYFSWLAQELSKRGHEVHIFSRIAEGIHGKEYQIHRVPVWRYPRSLRILSFLINSTRILRRYHFDIIHGVEGGLVMNIFNPHEGVEKSYLKQEFLSIPNRWYYLYKFLKRYLSPHHYLKVWIQKKQYLSNEVKRIIAISKMVKEDIIKYYGIPEEKIKVIFNCVDLDRFHPKNRDRYRNEKREQLGIGPNVLLLLFVGNNYRLKGVDPLLHAVVLLKKRFPKTPFHLLIVGRGQRWHYKRLAGRIGVSDLTFFIGPVKDIEQYYAASDVYVHPTFYDSFSLTVLEALASGLPVVTSRFAGAAALILTKEGGKVLDDPADIEDLADSIAYFFDEERRNKARVATRQWVEKYSPTHHIEDILRIYYGVVKEAKFITSGFNKEPRPEDNIASLRNFSPFSSLIIPDRKNWPS
jgi:UDP-glucose:(heptosyl)LPS alpha-1,3-glucosyltransferase